MKNLINYYYNLFMADFKKVDDCYFFDIDNKKYAFFPFDGDVNNLYKVYSTLKSNGKYCHEIVVNKDNSIVTFYLNKPYILLKKNIYLTNLVTLEEIFNYDILIKEKAMSNWKDLWKEKIDYYEYQINQLGFKYKVLKQSFDYYIGLSETAIQLLNLVDFKTVNYHICHKRIKYKEKMDDFLNPVNIVIDNRTRDIAEYFKINYINDSITLEEVFRYLQIINLNYSESILLLSRLIYPTYYFDIYDKIIQEKVSEDKVNFYIKKNADYETFIKNIYIFFKKYKRIPEIEWLEN